MDYARLGKSGLQVSRICFGTMSFGKKTDTRPWVLDAEKARPMFRRAWEKGINFYDTANIYAEGTSEEITGALLKELSPNRDEYVLATKCFRPMRPTPNSGGLSRKAIFSELDNSLRRLKADWVDLYQIHRFDPDTPAEETMEALHDVVKAGKARYIGASSMWAWQFQKYQHAADRHGWTRFVSMQNQLSLVYREEEREMMPLCRADGVGVIPWSPLGGGKVARPWGGKTQRSTTDRWNKTMYESDRDRPIVEAVEMVANAKGVAMAQVAMAWVLQAPGVTAPIVGVSRIEHVDDAVAALEFKLTADDVRVLEAPYQPLAVTGF
jgi:aryl-alcohol dehydrogenase-like predicted oxidoreductase